MAFKFVGKQNEERKDGEQKKEGVGLKMAGILMGVFGASTLAPTEAVNAGSSSLPAEGVGIFMLVAGVTMYVAQKALKPLLRDNEAKETIKDFKA